MPAKTSMALTALVPERPHPVIRKRLRFDNRPQPTKGALVPSTCRAGMPLALPSTAARAASIVGGRCIMCLDAGRSQRACGIGSTSEPE